jgi:acetoin utilization deacetylase AcuC-like enzyme
VLAIACVFLEHPSSLEHDTATHPGQAAITMHPEQPSRIVAIERALSARGRLGFERVRSPAVDRSVLTAVHSERYVASIERACAAGGGLLDADTVVSERSFEAALHAAGGAVRMVELLLDGEASAAFSSHRPPGHHALPSEAMGFCLFNNIAVAARYALDVRHLERVMILDWDVHHGNSTNQVFHASNQVLFVRIHQSPLFPGTGPAHDVGEGEGRGFTVNLPGASGIRGRGLRVARRARRRTASPRVRATAGARLRGIRRASRRSARGLRRDRGGVRGDGACRVPSVCVAGRSGRRRIGGRICAWGTGPLGGGDA